MATESVTDAVIEARLALLRARYPDKFGPDDESRIRQRIERSLRLAETLKCFPLANGDQPFVSIAAVEPIAHGE